MSTVVHMDQTGNQRYNQTIRPIRLNRTPVASSWVYSAFKRRECVKFVPSPTGDLHKCICGRTHQNHNYLDDLGHHINSDWNPGKDTCELQTDAVGTLEFQGTGEGDKAQFIRLSDTTPYSNMQKLLQSEWELELPKLIITVHGGEKHLDLTSRQRSIIGSGLIRATRTTEAWIMSIGLHSGVGELVGSALHDHQLMRRGRIRAVGVAPWGIVDNREDLLHGDSKPAGPLPYQTMADPLSKGSVLNACHTHFLLVDNGTESKWGNELKFRRNLENSLVKKDRIPMVCLIVEGDKTTIETVKEKVNNNIPVVICAGTGSNRVFDYGQARNAADLIAYAHSHTDEHGSIPKEVRQELRRNIQQWLGCKPDEENSILLSINQLIRRKKLIKIYRLDLPSSEPSRSIDHAILTAIFNSKTKPDPDKWLKMAMSWDRADIARSQIFAFPHGQDFPVGSLERRLEEALINNRVEFVNLLMENGVSMHKFLTYKRMEDLYNQTDKPEYLPIHLKYLFQDVTKGKYVERYNLIHVGQVVELLMGGTYRCHYTRKRFRLYYEMPENHKTFDNPFHELFIWAVLMKRPEMARFMWQKGEEALAKALVAMKMFKRMAQEAEDDDINQEEIQSLRSSSENFKAKALEILKLGYKESEKMCYQLLTYELKSWSRHTCLSLAVLAQHRDFIAHPCVQNILSDLMMGGLDLRRHSNIKVPLSLLCLPIIALCHILPKNMSHLFVNFIRFKTHEQLLKQPQTMKEFLEEYEDFDPGMTTRYNETSSDSSSSSTDSERDLVQMKNLNKEAVSLMDSKKSPRSDHVVNNVTFHDIDQDVIRIKTFGISSNTSIHKVDTPVKKGDLDFYRKSYEYLNAPITKFWSNLFFYIAFLVCFSYVILLDTQKYKIYASEWFIIIYIWTFAIENLRSMALSTPCSVWAKIKNWHSKLWNLLETLAIIIFIIGFFLRSTALFKYSALEYPFQNPITNKTIFEPELTSNEITLIGYGRAFYSVDLAIWLTRIFKFCSVNKTLGPYVTMAGKMMMDMFSFIFLLFIVLASFGICRQAIIKPQKTWTWTILKNITMEPYFMLYGEVYAADIDPCTPENAEKDWCKPGAWFVPVMMTIFLLVANILLLNLLIAVFNNTFARTKQESNQIWATQRYEVIMQYEAHPLFPPPLIIFSHLKILLDKLLKSKKFKMGQFSPDRGLKLFLNEEEEEVLHDWEEELVDDYYRLKRSEDGKGFEEQMRSAAERIPKMERHLEEVELRNTHLRNTIWDISARIMRMEEAGIKFFEHLEIRSRKPSADNPEGPSGSMDRGDWNIDSEERLHHEISRYQNKNTRRPSFIPTDEISAGDLTSHLNKWKEGKKLQRIRRDSEFREEEHARKCLHAKRSYSNCSNREEKIKTSASSLSDDDSFEDPFSSEFAHSRSVPDLPKTINLPLSNEKTTGPPKVSAYGNNSRLDSRRPSLPVTIGLNHLHHQAYHNSRNNTKLNRRKPISESKESNSPKSQKSEKVGRSPTSERQNGRQPFDYRHGNTCTSRCNSSSGSESEELSFSEDCDLTAGGPLSSILKGQLVNKPLDRLKKRPRPKRPRRPDYKIGNKTWQDNPSDLDECAGYRRSASDND